MGSILPLNPPVRIPEGQCGYYEGYFTSLQENVVMQQVHDLFRTASDLEKAGLASRV